jgi:hypothetical protein
VVVWGGTENGKSGISSLLKDLITGLPPVTDLAKAAGVELPAVLGQVRSSIDALPSSDGAPSVRPPLPNQTTNEVQPGQQPPEGDRGHTGQARPANGGGTRN